MELINSKEGDTILTLKELAPVRMIKNHFYNEILEAQQNNTGVEELKNILGRVREKKGMFEENLDESELEIGQVSALIKEIKPAEKIIKEIWLQFSEALSAPLK